MLATTTSAGVTQEGILRNLLHVTPSEKVQKAMGSTLVLKLGGDIIRSENKTGPTKMTNIIKFSF